MRFHSTNRFLVGLFITAVIVSMGRDVRAAASGAIAAPASPSVKSQPSALALPMFKSTHLPAEESPTPELSDTCGTQSTIVGTDTAGIVTVESAYAPGLNVGCVITFAEKFKTPVCIVGMHGGSTDGGNRAVIIQQKPESLHFRSLPNNFQGGEKVTYQCFEATP